MSIGNSKKDSSKIEKYLESILVEIRGIRDEVRRARLGDKNL